MSVALRSDPITFGDLQDALDYAATRARAEIAAELEQLHDDIETYRYNIKELLAMIDKLAAAVDAFTAPQS